MSDMLVIGKILKAHGVRGDVKITPITADVERFRYLENVTVKPGSPGERKFAVKSIKFISGGRYIILGLEGISTMEEADALRNLYIHVSEDESIELVEGAYFIHQLVGLRVIDQQGKQIGIVKEVMDTPANDVLVCTVVAGFACDSDEFMVPFIEDADCDVDLENGTVRVSMDFVVS